MKRFSILALSRMTGTLSSAFKLDGFCSQSIFVDTIKPFSAGQYFTAAQPTKKKQIIFNIFELSIVSNISYPNLVFWPVSAGLHCWIFPFQRQFQNQPNKCLLLVQLILLILLIRLIKLQ